MKRLRIPAMLAVATLGCGGDPATTDAAVTTGDSGPCSTVCYPNGTDAGVCPTDPVTCVSADRMCPAGCTCSLFCLPDTPEGEMNCPREDGYLCAAPDGTCPAGCYPIG